MSSTQQLLLGEGAGGAAPVFIEDLFSTYLYTGNSSTQTITNNINLSTKGGLVWCKDRTTVDPHFLSDTAQGTGKDLASDLTYGATTQTGITAFNTTGFTLGNIGNANTNTRGYVSWTFRKQPKFFDVVTWTGNATNRTIAHSLGAVPGCIIVKRTDATQAWAVYHSSLANTEYLVLNTTAAKATGATWWNSTTPTSSVFSVGTDASVNASAGTYVAYLFAHDAGGFGLTGTDNVITCGSYAGNGSTTGPTVTLGYEPQWLLIKNITLGTQTWAIHDNMRGLSYSTGVELRPNTTDPEFTSTSRLIKPLATGFQPGSADDAINASGSTYIYIAIRRGPMKVPTVGTSVFGINARTGTGANATVTGGQTDDAVLIKNRGSAVGDLFASRLTGTGYLETSSTAAEVAAGVTILQANPWDVMDGVKVGTTSTITNASATTFINYLFTRAPGFFDEVCYTGTGAAATQTHNLGVAPEMMIVKRRNGATNWGVYSSSLAAPSAGKFLSLNLTTAVDSSDFWNNTSPTATQFSTDSSSVVNASGGTYVAYLFATCAGVSKVGSYTGTAVLQTINCGFTTGARFVLIKRSDSTGDWYTYDSTRGLSSSTDPYFLLNSTAAEVTGTNYVDTDTTGFKVTAAASTTVNVSAATYIFLAIA